MTYDNSSPYAFLNGMNETIQSGEKWTVGSRRTERGIALLEKASDRKKHDYEDYFEDLLQIQSEANDLGFVKDKMEVLKVLLEDGIEWYYVCSEDEYDFDLYSQFYF